MSEHYSINHKPLSSQGLGSWHIEDIYLLNKCAKCSVPSSKLANLDTLLGFTPNNLDTSLIAPMNCEQSVTALNGKA